MVTERQEALRGKLITSLKLIFSSILLSLLLELNKVLLEHRDMMHA